MDNFKVAGSRKANDKLFNHKGQIINLGDCTEKEYRGMCKYFYKFIIYMFKKQGLPRPTWLQLAMAVFLQFGGERIITQGYRGIGKSLITSMFAVWVLWLNPDAKILVVSASGDRAKDFSLFVQRMISEIPILQHMKPSKVTNSVDAGGLWIEDSERTYRWSIENFDVAGSTNTHMSSVKSRGITGQITGSRADLVIADDVEVPNNSATANARVQLLKRVREFSVIATTDKGVGRIVYLGTPQSIESIYNELARDGFVTQIFPICYPDRDLLAYFGEKLCKPLRDRIAELEAEGTYDLHIGKSADPERFNETELALIRRGETEADFNLQMMLDTRLADAERYPLKLNDLVVMPSLDSTRAPLHIVWGGKELKELHTLGFIGDTYRSPLHVGTDWAEYTAKTLVIDPSGRGADSTTYKVIFFLAQKVFLMDWGSVAGTGYSPENLEFLAHTAKTWGVHKVIVESNFGDGMYTALLEPKLTEIYPCELEEYVSKGQKEVRIIGTMEPVLNQHLLVVSEAAIKKELKRVQLEEVKPYNTLMYQLTHLTSDRGSLLHDDYIDCLAIGVHSHTEDMKVSESRHIEKHKSENFKKTLASFRADRSDMSGRSNIETDKYANSCSDKLFRVYSGLE